MKQRIVKKIERRMLVDKVCELQHQIDEYERLIGDIMLIICRKDPDHHCLSFADSIDIGNDILIRCQDLVRENKALSAQNLKEKEVKQ